ncbi:MAG: hypothetical protein Q9217_002162 [Psora testacea]
MSNLRYSVISQVIPPTQINRTTTTPPPAKKQKMSLTQTYMLAHLSRKQLSKEAARPDHDLRRLVGHANMLDNLMLDLANAEEEQESWFNQTVNNASNVSEAPKHVQWADNIPEEVFDEEEEEEEESDNDSMSEDEELVTAQSMHMRKIARTPAPTPASTPAPTVAELGEEDEEMEDDDDYEDDLALRRTSSVHPPELMQEDSDSESDDDSTPPSPPQTEMTFDPFSEKQRQAIATSSLYQSDKSIPEVDQASMLDHQGYYLPQRQTAIATY